MGTIGHRVETEIAVTVRQWGYSRVVARLWGHQKSAQLTALNEKVIADRDEIEDHYGDGFMEGRRLGWLVARALRPRENSPQ